MVCYTADGKVRKQCRFGARYSNCSCSVSSGIHVDTAINSVSSPELYENKYWFATTVRIVWAEMRVLSPHYRNYNLETFISFGKDSICCEMSALETFQSVLRHCP
jgi:hypothetical protein